MNICIVGTGYVGLVSGVCLADKGHHVTCVDVDSVKVSQINNGIPPIYEKGLAELLARNVGTRLVATTHLESAVCNTDVTLIAVGTPFNGNDIDLSQIRVVCEQIGAALAKSDRYHVIAVKSTVVPGTTQSFVLPILERTSGKCSGADFGVGMNPEFLREGEAIQDFLEPDRIVLGGIDERTLDALSRVYAVFQNVDVLRTSTRTAEMIKYTANTLLATLISFSNEIGNLCAEEEGVDVIDVMRGVHLDKRFSPLLQDGSRITPGFLTYLAAGCGFGGSCFPKDVKALLAYARKKDMPLRIAEAVMDVNDRQPGELIRLLKQSCPCLTGLRVAVLGMAFKPGTDDMRESPALHVVPALHQQGVHVTAYDPIACEEAMRQFAGLDIRFGETLTDAIQDVDVVMLLTTWPEFERVPELVNNLTPVPLIVDGRRMLQPSSVARYQGIGIGMAARA